MPIDNCEKVRGFGNSFLHSKKKRIHISTRILAGSIQPITIYTHLNHISTETASQFASMNVALQSMNEVTEKISTLMLFKVDVSINDDHVSLTALMSVSGKAGSASGHLF
jgi:hypothetical protein